MERYPREPNVQDNYNLVHRHLARISMATADRTSPQPCTRVLSGSQLLQWSDSDRALSRIGEFQEHGSSLARPVVDRGGCSFHIVELACRRASCSGSGAGTKVREHPGESYAIWQIPSRPVAVLLVAHGLHHGAGTFWDAAPGCQICSPLPEERLVTKAALSRGYAVVAVQGGSKDRGWNLETDLEINPDFLRVSEFLRPWRRDHGLESLPLLAYGLSRGGDFVSVLALGMRLSGVVLMVSPGMEAAVELAAVRSAAGLRIWPYPPTLFVHMPKDSVTDQEVQRRMASLSAKGLGTGEIRCYAFPVYESLFSDRIPGLNLNVSSAIFEALEAEGYLTPDGFLNQPDPVDWETYGDWDWNAVVQSLKQVMLPQANGTDSQVWIEAVAEELSLSYGFHSCSSLPSVQIMDWLDRTWRHSEHAWTEGTSSLILTTLVTADEMPSKLLPKHFSIGKNS